MQVDRHRILDWGISSLNLTLEESGYADLDHRWHSDDTCSPYSRLYLVEAGEGILETEQEHIRMHPGMAYLVPAGLTFRFRCPVRLKKLYFHIHIPKPDHYDLLQELKVIGQLPVSDIWLKQMVALYNGSDLAQALCIQAQLLMLVGDFLEKYRLGQEPIKTYSRLVADSIRMVQENLSAGLRVAELAKQQFVSRRYLTEVFRKEVGVPLSRYIDDHLLSEAQRRLAQADDSIGHISSLLGFNDPFYFSRWFKKHNGITPREYRSKTKDPIIP